MKYFRIYVLTIFVIWLHKLLEPSRVRQSLPPQEIKNETQQAYATEVKIIPAVPAPERSSEIYLPGERFQEAFRLVENLMECEDRDMFSAMLLRKVSLRGKSLGRHISALEVLGELLEAESFNDGSSGERIIIDNEDITLNWSPVNMSIANYSRRDGALIHPLGEMLRMYVALTKINRHYFTVVNPSTTGNIISNYVANKVNYISQDTVDLLTILTNLFGNSTNEEKPSPHSQKHPH